MRTLKNEATRKRGPVIRRVPVAERGNHIMFKTFSLACAAVVGFGSACYATALVDLSEVNTLFVSEYPDKVATGVKILAVVIVIGLAIKILRRFVGK